MARSFAAGSSQSISFPSATATNVGSGDFTALAWVRFPALPADNTMIVGKRAGGFNGDEGWEIHIEDASNDGVEFRAQTDVAGEQTAKADLTGLTDGNWHLVAGDHTETAPAGLRIWYDGAIAATKAATTIGSHDTTTPLVIAAASDTPNTNYLTGEIGAVAIFKRLLSTAEHQMLAAGFSPRFLRPLPVFLAELISRASPEPDIMAGLSGTLENAPAIVDNPRIVLPRAADIGQDLWYEFANAQIDGQSALVVTPTRGRTASATVVGQSAVTPTITRARDAVATVVGQSTLTASLSVLVPLDATIAGQSAVAADISANVAPESTIAGQSAITASVNIDAAVGAEIEGQSSIQATLSADVPVSATITGQSALTAAATAAAPISATIAGQSALTVTGDRIRTLSTTIAGQSAMTSAATITAGVAALIEGQSGISAALTATAPLSASIAAQSGVAGTLTASVPVSATVTGASGVTATVTRAQPASAQIDGQSALTADIAPRAPVEAVIAAQSTVTATLSATVPLQAGIDAESSITVRPTYPGTKKTITVGGVARWLATVGGRITR